MRSDLIFKIMCDPKTKIKKISKKTRFSLKGAAFECPTMISGKIMKAIRKSSYKLARELIDIYKDNFVANF